MNQEKKNILGWIMYDFANSSFTTIIVTVIYSVYFKNVVVGAGERGTKLWGIAVSISMLLAMAYFNVLFISSLTILKINISSWFCFYFYFLFSNYPETTDFYWYIFTFVVVPDSILNKKPSADLWEGQSDEEELG